MSDRITHDKLFGVVSNLYKSGISSFEIRKEETSYGDRYHSEVGADFYFKIAGKIYQVGYSNITDDDDDWAQAEAYTINISRKNDRSVDPKIIYDDIINAVENERKFKLNILLK